MTFLERKNGRDIVLLLGKCSLLALSTSAFAPSVLHRHHHGRAGKLVGRYPGSDDVASQQISYGRRKASIVDDMDYLEINKKYAQLEEDLYAHELVDASSAAAERDMEIADGVPPATLTQVEDEDFAAPSATLSHLALAGALATIIADMTMHPMDSIKTLQQSDSGYGLTLLQAAHVMYEQSGWGAFYHGFFTYAFSDAMGGALKFVTYELGKQLTLHKMDVKETSQIQQSLAVFACAAMAFVASSIVVVPGELMKQQLQMNLYDGLPQAMAGMFEKSGLLGFYTGYSGVLLRDIPYTMLELGLYEIIKNGMLDWKQKRQQQQGSQDGDVRFVDEEDALSSLVVSTPPQKILHAWEEVVAAALTGGATAYLTTPLDTIKTKLMVDQDLYAGGFLDCLVSTVDHHGLGALFAGGAARVAWLVPYTAIYLPVYDLLKRKFSTETEPPAVQAAKKTNEPLVAPTPIEEVI
jgi:hypothetical protein